MEVGERMLYDFANPCKSKQLYPANCLEHYSLPKGGKMMCDFELDMNSAGVEAFAEAGMEFEEAAEAAGFGELEERPAEVDKVNGKAVIGKGNWSVLLRKYNPNLLRLAAVARIQMVRLRAVVEAWGRRKDMKPVKV